MSPNDTRALGAARDRLARLADTEATWPLRTHARVLAAILAGYGLATAAARLAHDPALVALAAGLALVALLLPRTGLTTLVMLIPAQGLGAFGRSDMAIVTATLLSAIALRHLGLWRGAHPARWPLLLQLFAAVLAIHALWTLAGALNGWPEAELRAAALEWGFLAGLFAAAHAARDHAVGPSGDGFRAALLVATGYGLGLTVVVDGIAVFFPAIDQALRLVRYWPDTRFAGLHVNPNATAKFLSGGIAIVVALLWAAPLAQSRPWWRTGLPTLAAGLVVATALAATLSKTTLLGTAAALLLVSSLFLMHRRWRLGLVGLAALGGIAVTTLGYDALLALRLADLIRARHQATLEGGTAEPAKPAGGSAAEVIGRELRLTRSWEMKMQPPAPRPPDAVTVAPTPPTGPKAVAPASKPSQPAASPPTPPAVARPKPTAAPGTVAPPPQRPAEAASVQAQNSEMYRNIQGKIEYTERDCGWRCTGQRDRLWGKGLEILRENWVVGIGPARWAGEYLRRAGFPFDSPHNVVLEMGGAFGLAGLAAYGLLLVALARLTRAVIRAPLAPARAVFVRATLLFTLTLAVTEWFDPARFFTMNPHAVWLWLWLAALPGEIEPGRAIGDDATPRPGPQQA